MTPSYLILSDLERSKSRSLSFVSCKGAELGHMLLLNINSKAYKGESTGMHLTSVTLKGQCQGHSNFETLYLVKEPVLNINRKPYMGSPMTLPI